jgi:hypothetical protein
MRTLRTVCAIFTATTGLDAEQAATLHLFAAPLLEMHRPAPRDQIEERPLIERVEFLEIHCRAAMVNRKSAI